MKVREKYKGLSREALLDKAYELGRDYEKNSKSCCQSTVAALHELLEIDDIVVKVATSSAGGQAGQVSGTCGALIGGTMVLDYFFGRPVEKTSHVEFIPENVGLLMDAMTGPAATLYQRFVKEYGSIICPHIQVNFFGRHFYFLDPDNSRKMDEAADEEHQCHKLVGNAARWVIEIMLDKGLKV